MCAYKSSLRNCSQSRWKKIYVTSQETVGATNEFKHGYYNAYEIYTTNNYAVTPLPLISSSFSVPFGIAVDGTKVYVVYTYTPESTGGAIDVIDAANNYALVKTLCVPPNPQQIAVNPQLSTAYVA